MFIELVEALRCPIAHEDSWLVVAADRTHARHIVNGTLGCPVCSATFPIRDGVADFRRAHSLQETAGMPTDPEMPMRLAALMDLSGSQGFAVLVGSWGTIAHELSAIVEVPVIAVDPPQHIIGGPGVSVLRTDDVLPLANGSARASALSSDAAMRIASAVTATRGGGRLVGPSDIPLPDGVRELARDDLLWVGEREETATPLLTLHVRRG